MSQPYSALLASHPTEWKTRQVVILDWMDGPKAGLCALLHPACCFWFQIVGEPVDNRRSQDALFQIYIAPPTAMDELLEKLSELGPPRRPSWGAIWLFATEQAEKEADNYINDLQQRLESSSLFVQSTDLITFTTAWNAFPEVPFFKIQ